MIFRLLIGPDSARRGPPGRPRPGVMSFCRIAGDELVHPISAMRSEATRSACKVSGGGGAALQLSILIGVNFKSDFFSLMSRGVSEACNGKA